MRLEDSLLYLILDDAAESGAADFCAAAIAGGVDVIQMPISLSGDSELLKSVREVCLRDDALFVVSGDASLEHGVEADGVHLSSATDSVGQARAMIGVDALVGMSTQSRTDAILGIEVGADYLLHWAGTACSSLFSGFPGATACTLFAAGLSSLDDARTVVDGGVYRLCIESSLLSGGDVTENAAAFSRVLGRSI